MLPKVLLNLIAEMASDLQYELYFLYSATDRLTKIRIKDRATRKTYPLHKHTWRDIRDLSFYPKIGKNRLFVPNLVLVRIRADTTYPLPPFAKSHKKYLLCIGLPTDYVNNLYKGIEETGVVEWKPVGLKCSNLIENG